MRTFRETRWQPALGWLVLALIFALSSRIPTLVSNIYVRYLGMLAAIVCVGYAFWKILFPSLVLAFDSHLFKLRGVRPGWWKFTQLWKTVEIKDEDVLDIRLGKIREESWFGKHAPFGEPSAGRTFQSFLWIRYLEGGKQKEIYYPDIYNIQNTEVLVAELKQRFRGKVKVSN